MLSLQVNRATDAETDKTYMVITMNARGKRLSSIIAVDSDVEFQRLESHLFRSLKDEINNLKENTNETD